MYPEVERITEILTEGLLHVLGETLLGVYLTGSAVTPDFDPSASDIDLFVITTTPISRERAEALSILHERLERHHPWALRLEVQYACREQLHPRGVRGEAPTRGSTRGFEITSSAAGPDDILGVRQFGHAITGPPPNEVFPAVNEDTFLAGTKEYLEDLLTRHVTRPNAGDSDFADWVLNIARCLYRMETRTLGSKRVAHEWLVRRAPNLSPILSAAAAARAGDLVAASICRQQFGSFAENAKRLAAEMSS